MDTEGEYQRTEPADRRGQSESKSGWITTDVAASALGVTPRTVRRFIDRGELEAHKVERGITEAWEVSIDSLYSLKAKRESEGHVRRESANKSAGYDDTSDSVSDVLRELTARLEQRAASEGDLRARLELTERAESSLREDLVREREERRQAQEENKRLREELEAERSKGFWRRLLGG